MRLTVMLIIVEALGTVLKGLKREQEELEVSGRNEIIQTTIVLRSARILRRVLRTFAFTQTPMKVHQLTLM